MSYPPGPPQSGPQPGSPQSGQPSGPSSEPPTVPPPSGPPTTPPPSGPPTAPPPTQVPGQQKAQGWPTYVPPAGPPRTGWSTPPGSTPPPWQTGTSYGGPPKRNTGLLIGGVVLVLALIAGIGVAGWLLLRGDGDTKNAADPASPAGASASTGSPSASPSVPPVPPVSSATPPPKHKAPKTSKPHVDSDPNKLTTSDFSGDWNFALGGVQLSAKKKFFRDYPTCDGIGSQKLIDAGCQYAAFWAYTAFGGKLEMTQVAYVMGSAKQAKSAASDLEESDLNLPPGSEISDFSYGQWEHKASTKVVVVTLVTAKKSVSKSDADDYLHYGNADLSGAMSFMFM